MAKLTRATADRVISGGKLNKIPGYAGLTLDQLPILIQSGLVNLFGGASGNLINYLVPFDYKAISAWAICTVVPGTAAAVIAIGTTAATTGILNNENIGTAEATTFQDLTQATSFTGASLFGLGNQGDIIVFSTDGGGTATGKAIWGCTIVPN